MTTKATIVSDIQAIREVAKRRHDMGRDDAAYQVMDNLLAKLVVEIVGR